MEKPNPCVGCGACCACFRVSFYWAETDAGSSGGIPVELTEKINHFMSAMKGTNDPSPRCVALTGTVGADACCSIYERRSSPCREFEASWYNGEKNERCDRARAVWGLEPLGPDAWNPGDVPRAA